MKDSKEKEHRISNLKDMINNVKDDEISQPSEELKEDDELIDYLNERPEIEGDFEIDDEFIYHIGDEKEHAINLEENDINEEFIIKTPKEEDMETSDEIHEFDENDDIIGGVSENFDMFVNAKIGRTPILAIISSVLGVLFILISVFIFMSRSDRVIDSVTSGETIFTSIIVLALGILLLFYGIYRIFDIKNPINGFADSIDSIDIHDKKEKHDDGDKKDADENIIPKSNIPLDKDSYKIGEFDMDDLKNKLKKPATSKKPTPITEDIENIPPAKEKEESKKGLTAEEIEDIEYEQVKLDQETIDDIFAEVEDIDEMPIISIDSEDKKEE